MFTSAFLIIFLMLIFRGFKIAETAKDDFGKYLVVGIIGWLGVQASSKYWINGWNFADHRSSSSPFMSFGGTSLARFLLAAIGVVLSVSISRGEFRKSII